MLFLKGDQRVHDIQTGVLGQGLGNDEQSLGERLHTELGLALHLLLEELQVMRGGQLKRAGARNDGVVLNRVLDSLQPIPNCILQLSDGVRVGPLDQDGARKRVAHFLHESVLLLAKRLLVHLAREAQALLRHVIHRVHCIPTARQAQALHVAALGTSQRQNALLCQHIQRQWIDTLLVDHHEGLAVLRSAHTTLEVDHRLDLLVSEPPLRCNHPLALFRGRVVEPRGHLTPLVLQRHVHGQNVRIAHHLGHVRMARAVIQHQTLDQSRVRGHLVHHVHLLHHVQVDGHPRPPDAQHRIRHDIGELVSQLWDELGADGRARNAAQKLTVHISTLLELEGLEELDAALLGELKAV
mmetsp:Transcript_16194/g.51498  ORF Transcript_16194/g.51498 Transcript_16194/m.51498 type:complete len:354 (+) Transcript_16194:1354-2415(+)